MSSRVRIRLTDTGESGVSDVEITESGFVVTEDRWTEGTEVILRAASGTFVVEETSADGGQEGDDGQ